MIEYETIWTRTVVLVARTSMLGAVTRRSASDTVSALQEFVLVHVKRILEGLRRDLDDADMVASDAARDTLQRVALGKASCGLAALEEDRRLADARPSDSRVPPLRFSIACQTLLWALNDDLELASLGERRTTCGGSEPDPPQVPDLPRLRLQLQSPCIEGDL